MIETLPDAWIGIDIAKLNFEACLLRAQGKPLHKQFAHTSAGFAKLLRWVASLAPEVMSHYCLEATGAYSEALALFLAEAEQNVSLVNPFRIKHAALAQGAGNKTDKADAKLIADYCRQYRPPLWRRSAPEVRVLVALLRRLSALSTQRQQEANRLQEPNLPKPVVTSLKQSIRFLDRQINTLEAQIEEHINRHPGLKADRDLLISIPGIGEATAAWILAELPDVAQFASAQDAAAYAGLAPCEYRSGTSVRKRTRLSKRGNARLRTALYFPAMSACRFNPLVRALYERLLQKGLCRKAALGAAMRKLLMIAYGVLKSRKEFCVKAAEAAT